MITNLVNKKRDLKINREIESLISLIWPLEIQIQHIDYGRISMDTLNISLE